MSRIINAITASGPKWSTESIIFTSLPEQDYPLSNRQGQNFGASMAYAILGPDIKMPGGETNNPPTVTGYPWNNPPTFVGGPEVTFDEDESYTWIRGHLINGRWAGSGDSWDNITPLTSIGNSNHKTIESYMDRYLENSLAFDNADHRYYWYGIYYAVQCSTTPFAAIPENNDLYSYAPEFIRVTWRAIKVLKPEGYSVAEVKANPLMAGEPITVPDLPFDSPSDPNIEGWPVSVLPVGSAEPDGGVLGVLPDGFPEEQDNDFDGQIDILQESTDI